MYANKKTNLLLVISLVIGGSDVKFKVAVIEKVG